MEPSRKDDGPNPKQAGPKPTVPQKPVGGKGVRVVLVIFIIVLLVILAGVLGVRQDQWRDWQDEIVRRWRDFSVVQTMPDAGGPHPQPVAEGISPDSEMIQQADSETALPLHNEVIPEAAAADDEQMESLEASTRPGEDQLLLVEFDFDSIGLSADSRGILDKAAEEMFRSHDSSAIITGYSDNRGAEAYNLNLSYKRADAVAQYLVSRDIGRHRLQLEGRGSRQDFSNTNASESASKYGERRVVEIQISTTSSQ